MVSRVSLLCRSRPIALKLITYPRYVVSTSRRSPVDWSTISSEPSSSTGKLISKPDEQQQVFIGIFPASHIYFRDELSDAEGRLAEIVSSLQEAHAQAQAQAQTHAQGGGSGSGGNGSVVGSSASGSGARTPDGLINNGHGLGNNGANNGGHGGILPPAGGTLPPGIDLFAAWNRDKIFESLRERDEICTGGGASAITTNALPLDDSDAVSTARRSFKSFKLDPPPDQAPSSTRARLPVYPASIRSASPTDSQILKPLPPRPSLKSGDDTASGAAQPIIDELASALREWHGFMFQYLARRDYRMFHVVREHIEVLHLGRRQLLSQTLSSEETLNLRRECVARLVSGNVVQGLDVIVRHPTWGGLVSVDVSISEGNGAPTSGGGAGGAGAAGSATGDGVDTRNWVSAVRMYAMQVSLAYIDVSPTAHPYRLPQLGGSIDYATNTLVPTPTQAHSAFPEYLRTQRGLSVSRGGSGPGASVTVAGGVGSATKLSASGRTTSIADSPQFPHFSQTEASTQLLAHIQPHAPTRRPKFYHVFLDLRAFVATPCAPGETVELLFSLYNKAEARFVSEEFCAVLNHNGVLARDPSPAARIRTLFTDLIQGDAQDPIFLVCQIVRNGGMKLGGGNHQQHQNIGAGTASDSGQGGRRTSDHSMRGWTSTSTDRQASNTMLSDPALLSDPYPTSNSNSSPLSFRRPFGCAVLELTQLNAMASEQTEVSSTREHTMPIWVPTDEATFSMLHQDILNGKTREYQKSPRYVLFSTFVTFSRVLQETLTECPNPYLRWPPLPRAEMMAVSIKVFYGDAATVVRENTSLLQDTPLSLRLGFPDVVFPGDVRNELYIKLWSGDFSASQTSVARRSVPYIARLGNTSGNVQVSVEVRNQHGRAIERVISQCSGEPEMTTFNSMVFERTTQPTFGELIKIKLPLEGAQQWHLFFTFRQRRNGRDRMLSMGSSGRNGNSGGNAAGGTDVLERPFAFAFLPLFPDGRAFLEDGSHSLVLYRADRLSQISADMYINATACLPPSLRADQLAVPVEMQRLAPAMRDTLIIRSSLVSTKFTQNGVLLSLLNWEKISDKEFLATILTKFTFVGEVEIVKFLRDIFDSLFAILASHNNQTGEMDHLVFNALVTVLGIVQDRRFSNFQPVLDEYIEKHFSCASSASHMIHSMNQLLQDPTSPVTASSLRAALKVWHYIFKFIARSRELQKVKEIGMGGGATADHLEGTFKRELREHLSQVNRMMATATPASIIGTQTIALQHFTSILPELVKVFTTIELVTIATSFASSIALAKGRIAIWKLIMYLQIVKGFLFDIPESRSLLVESVVIWIKPYFGKFDEYAQISPGDTDSARDAARMTWLESIRLSVTVVAVMLDKLQQSLVQPSVVSDRIALRREQYNIEYLLSLLPR